MDNEKKNKNIVGNTYFWWKIDESDLAIQTLEYKTLRLTKSARKISSILLLLSVLITVTFIWIGYAPPNALIDAGLMTFLSFFVFMGHRWALWQRCFIGPLLSLIS